MRHLAYCLLPTLTVAVTLCGCAVSERRQGPEFSGVVPKTASAEAGAEPSPGVRPAERPAGVDLLVYGLSYHTDREGVHRSHLDNELNVGLGLSYEFHNDDRGVAFFGAGFYKDSGRNWAKFAGPGYQLRLGDRWRFGGGLMIFDSRTYNHGRIFVAPIPLLTYDLGTFKLNALYAPRVRDYNDFAVFGLYFSIPLSAGRSVR